jgi:hypothetical protein
MPHGWSGQGGIDCRAGMEKRRPSGDYRKQKEVSTRFRFHVGGPRVARQKGFNRDRWQEARYAENR